jgi:acetyl-CoA acetyltransferase
MTPLMNKTAIVGIGQTKLGKGFDESEEELSCIAIKAALDDAGLKPSEVDGITSFTMQTVEEEELVRDLGLNELTYFARSPAGGGCGCGTVGHAAMAIATGEADVVVAYRARKRSGRASRMWSQQQQAMTRELWTRPFGIIRPVDEIALLARRYMHEYGATRDHLANIALGFRRHANMNPNAFMHGKPMTREQYHAARMISDPCGLFDCCLENDGALAVVLTSAERARDLKRKPAYIHSFAQGITRDSAMMANFYARDPFNTQSWAAAKLLWNRSDFKPADMASAQIYDAFSPEIWFVLEGYGFAKRGEGATFTENGNIEVGGKLPVNTSGGSLLEAYVHGFNMILEGVRQVRGESTAQVPDTKAVFVCSSDIVPTGALVLRA